jgi:hypothetical protein
MRFIRNLLLLIIPILVVAYLAANYALDKGSQEILAIIKQRTKSAGIQLDELEYDSVRISSPRSVTWFNTSARFRWSDKRFLKNETEFNVAATEVEISLVDFSSRVVRLSARNFNAAPTSQTVQKLIVTDPKIAKGFRSGSMEGRVFEVTTTVNPKNPLQSVKLLAKDLFELAKKGSTAANINFQGKVKMRIRGSDIEAKVLSVKRDNETHFVLDRQDVAQISERFDDKLTQAEINIIANNPTKAPLLFTIKDYAETKASDAYANDNSLPQDPYRHVLWSYLLTKEFGPEFAKKITNAHEEGPTGNSALERKQDYHNNAVGRRYAADNVQQGEILQRVRTDPEVMRQWNRG